MKEVTFTAGESNPILTINPTTGEITQKTAVDTSGFVSTTLNSGRVLVGSPGNAATQVDTASVGDISADTTNGLQIKAGAIVNADINASAAIAYSKLALTGSIVNADVNASAAIAYSKLNLTGSITNADINAAAAIARTKLASGSSHRVIVNNASGVMTDAAAITANRVLVSNNDGIPVAAIPTTTEINRVAGVTSPIQTQLNSNIVGIAADSLVTNPTASEDGYAITWDNTAGEWTLIDPVVTGLPTGGTAGQFIIKNSGTNFDVSWADFEWANISDVSTTLADVELLSGLDAAGLTNAELQNLIGTTSNIQSQLTNKQDRSLTHNSIWVGNVSNVPTALSAGTNGYVLTISSGSPTWQPSVAGFSNPMTTTGDLILGDTGGAAIRLGIGSADHVLRSNGTTASWGTIATGGITNAAVTYAKIQNVAANSFLANATGSSATVQEIATSRIPLFGSAITGTPSATTYLRGDGTWATPAGSGSSFEDSAFEIYGNIDATKIAKFEVDGFTTATTRTFTLPNTNGTIALTSDLSGWLTGTLTGNATINGTGNYDLSLGGSSGQEVQNFNVRATEDVVIRSGMNYAGTNQLSLFGATLGAYFDLEGEFLVTSPVSSIQTTGTTYNTLYSSGTGAQFSEIGIASNGSPDANLPIRFFSRNSANTANFLVQMTPTKLSFKKSGTTPTAGQVWTALNSDGDGEWATPSGGGNFLKSDGNTTLLNSISIDGDSGTYALQFVDLNAIQILSSGSNLFQGNTCFISSISSADDALDLYRESVTDNSPIRIRLSGDVTGSPVIGSGVGLEFFWAENSGNSVATIDAVSTDITTSDEEFDLVFRSMSNGTIAEKLRIKSTGDIQFSAGGSGTSGQFLRSNGSGAAPTWETVSSGSSVLSDITAATGANTINSGANHQIWDWNSLTSGTGMSFRSSSTGAASNTLKVVSIEKSGANASSSQTTTALNVSNTSTGTTSTNVGLFASASGGTNNLAASFDGGVRVQTSTTGDFNIFRSNGSNWLRFDNTGIIRFHPDVNTNQRITAIAGVSLDFMLPGAAVGNHNGFSFFWNGALTATSTGITRLMTVGESNNGTTTGATLSSGTRNFTLLRASGAWNFTGTYLGTLIGYDYDPTLTSATGLTNLSFRATSGDMLVPASSYHNYGTTSGSSGYGFRDNAGTMEFKNSGGSWAAFGGGSGIGGSTGSVDNAMLRADGTGGSTAQASSVIISDTADIDLGVSGTTGTIRSISVFGSSTDIELELSAKGTSPLTLRSPNTIFKAYDDVYSINISVGSASTDPYIQASRGVTKNFSILGTEGENSGSVDGGNITIKSGIAVNNNGNGGHLFLSPGTKHGTGLDGNTAINVTSVSNWQSMERGLFFGNATTAPTGNPTDGVFEYSTDVEGTAEKYIRTESGAVVSATGLLEPVEIDTTTATLSEAHRGKFVYFTHASGCTVTVPTTLKKGFTCILMQDHASGTVTLTGATVNGKTATTAQYDKIGLVHYKDTDIYYGA